VSTFTDQTLVLRMHTLTAMISAWPASVSQPSATCAANFFGSARHCFSVIICVCLVPAHCVKAYSHLVELVIWLYHQDWAHEACLPMLSSIFLELTTFIHHQCSAAFWWLSNLGWKLTFSVYLLTVAYTSDFITFPPAPLKLWRYGAI